MDALLDGAHQLYTSLADRIGQELAIALIATVVGLLFYVALSGSK